MALVLSGKLAVNKDAQRLGSIHIFLYCPSHPFTDEMREP